MARDASTRSTGLSAHYLDPSKAVAFFDIDGTLVWRDFEALASGGSAEGVVGSFGAAPTPAVYDAFRRMTARGHASFICTGRPTVERCVLRFVSCMQRELWHVLVRMPLLATR